MSKDIYEELLHQTISSFLKFVAPHYKANPVRKGAQTETVPNNESCPQCKSPMTERHRTAKEVPSRVLWNWTSASIPFGGHTASRASEYAVLVGIRRDLESLPTDWTFKSLGVFTNNV
jgi:hypothetical protein